MTGEELLIKLGVLGSIEKKQDGEVIHIGPISIVVMSPDDHGMTDIEVMYFDGERIFTRYQIYRQHVTKDDIDTIKDFVKNPYYAIASTSTSMARNILCQSSKEEFLQRLALMKEHAPWIVHNIRCRVYAKRLGISADVKRILANIKTSLKLL